MKKLLLALCLLPCLLGMRAPYAVAYSASLGTGQAATALTVSIVTSGHVAGQMIVVAFVTDNSLSGGISSISDTGGNTYTSSTVANVSAKRTEIWVSNGAASAGTITITRAGSTGNAYACAVSYTGTSLTKESGSTANNTTGSSSATWTVVGNGTLSVVALGYVSTVPDTSGGQSGWTRRYDAKHTGTNLCLAYWDTGSSSPLTPGSNTFTDTMGAGGHSWTMIAQSFTAGGLAGRASTIPMTGAG